MTQVETNCRLVDGRHWTSQQQNSQTRKSDQTSSPKSRPEQQIFLDHWNLLCMRHSLWKCDKYFWMFSLSLEEPCRTFWRGSKRECRQLWSEFSPNTQLPVNLESLESRGRTFLKRRCEELFDILFKNIFLYFKINYCKINQSCCIHLLKYM